MDDFRVGSVPSSDPYDHRDAPGSIARKKPKHRDDESGQDEPGDTFEKLLAGDEESVDNDEPIEDYYSPSPRDADTE